MISLPFTPCELSGGGGKGEKKGEKGRIGKLLHSVYVFTFCSAPNLALFFLSRMFE